MTRPGNAGAPPTMTQKPFPTMDRVMPTSCHVEPFYLSEWFDE